MSILFKLILALHTIVALALVGVVLLQRSEGGVLGIGGGSSGLMTARGAADLLTQSTRWLATAFIATSIGLAVVAARDRKGDNSIVEELNAAKPGASKPAASKSGASAPKPAAPAVPIPGMDLSLPGTASSSPTPASADPVTAPQTLPPTPNNSSGDKPK